MSETLRPYGEKPGASADDAPASDSNESIEEVVESSPEGVSQYVDAGALDDDGGGAAGGDPPDDIAKDVGNVALAGAQVEDPGGRVDDPTDITTFETHTASDLERRATDGAHEEDLGGEVDDPLMIDASPESSDSSTDTEPHAEEGDLETEILEPVPESSDEPAASEDENLSIVESVTTDEENGHDQGEPSKTVPLEADNAGDVNRDVSDEEIERFLEARSPTESEMESPDSDSGSSRDASNVDRSDLDAGGLNGSPNSQGQEQTAPSETATESIGDARASDRISTNDAQVEKAWSASEKVAAGRSFVPAGDDMHEEAELIKPAPGEYSVIIHGNTDVVGIQHPGEGWQDIDPKGMADVLRSDPDWKSQPVHLLSCETGKQPSDGSPEFAQRLADELGVEVTAPTEEAWSSSGQIWVSSGRDITDPTTGETVHVPNSPAWNPDGYWKCFQPNV